MTRDAPRMLAWAEAAQADLLAALARAAGVRLATVSGPRRADARSLAEALECDRADDLRHAVAAGGHDVVLLAAPDVLEGDERRALRASNVQVAAFEPRPMTVSAFLLEKDEPPAAELVPRFRDATGMRLATEALQEFGPPELVEVFVGGRPDEGSLLARLADAVDVLLAHVPEPSAVAASVAGPPSRVPEHLAGLRGNLTLHARSGTGATAVAACSSTAGAWRRHLRFVGESGRLEIGDEGYRWTDGSGRLIDQGGGDDEGPELAEPAARGPKVIGAALARLLEAGGAAPSLADPAPVRARRFALCEAVRVSARTGEEEDPRRMAELLGLED